MTATILQQLLDTARRDVDSGWLPACQVAVARDGELIAIETLGGATNDDGLLVFSCTKPIVSSGVGRRTTNLRGVVTSARNLSACRSGGAGVRAASSDCNPSR